MSDFVFEYTARKKLTPGTIVGDAKILNIDLTLFNPVINAGESESVALDGTRYVVEDFVYDRYRCETQTVSGTLLAQVQEFLYSVLDGSAFTAINPDDGDRVMNCELVGKFSQKREGRNIGEFQFSFMIEDTDAI
jgi:hypothetical protein